MSDLEPISKVRIVKESVCGTLSARPDEAMDLSKPDYFLQMPATSSRTGQPSYTLETTCTFCGTVTKLAGLQADFPGGDVVVQLVCNGCGADRELTVGSEFLPPGGNQ